MFRPIRELSPFTNLNESFVRFANFCSVRELDPIDELVREHEIELTNLKLEASIRACLNPISRYL